MYVPWVNVLLEVVATYTEEVANVLIVVAVRNSTHYG